MARLCPAAPALLLGSLALLLQTALSVHHVPMLLWSTRRSQWDPDVAVHEGQVVSAQELTALLQPLFTQNSRNLVLFLQDRLSIDDFTYFSESYGNKNPFQNVQLRNFFRTTVSLKLESLFLQIAHLNSRTSYICSVGFGNLNVFPVKFDGGEEILQSSPSSLVLPAVDCEATKYLLNVLQESGDWKLTNVTDLSVSQLEVNASNPNLLVVHLQPLASDLKEISTLEAIAENGKQEIYINPVVIRMFTETSLDEGVTSRIFLKAGVIDLTDKIIGRVTMDLQQRGIHFSVIYTAVRPSRISRKIDVVAELRRQLMAAEEEESSSYPPLNVTIGNDTCILFYASNFSLKANSSVLIDLTNATFLTQNVDTSASECSDSNTTLSLKYTRPVNGISSLEIRFLMTNKFYEVSARRWSTLDSVEIVQDGEKLAKFIVSSISAPAEYSFHCQLVGTSNLYPARLDRDPSNNEAKNWDVLISNLQIQGFNIINNQFSYASDCTGFFTPGIWMGLLTSVILLWILTYGIHMIMQLTTNSRFDDPKGPALSVPQTE